jgi:predicted Fe-Mo cluster-binding NifX family protein
MGTDVRVCQPVFIQDCSKTMEIAVTSQNRKTVTKHAGRCRKFRIFAVEDGQITSERWLELLKEQAFHGYPADQPHPLDGINVLIAASMGQGLIRKLTGKDIEPVVTELEDPLEAVQVYLLNRQP